MQNPADPEQRAWLCLDIADFAACTTHLDATSLAVARRQCGYLLGAVLPALRQPGVLGGDFNLRADITYAPSCHRASGAPTTAACRTSW